MQRKVGREGKKDFGSPVTVKVFSLPFSFFFFFFFWKERRKKEKEKKNFLLSLFPLITYRIIGLSQLVFTILIATNERTLGCRRKSVTIISKLNSAATIVLLYLETLNYFQPSAQHPEGKVSTPRCKQE